MPLRLGAYVLPGDPVWLRSSLSGYYDLLDALVVPVPADALGWTGRPLPVAECLRAIREIDRRGLAREVFGRWVDNADPLRADTAQRQSAIDSLGDEVDWVLQIDNDELLPDPGSLLALIEEAESTGIGAVDWPMRVLYRRVGRGRYLEVRGNHGEPVHDYPGPVAVRAGSRLRQARRVAGPLLRPTVVGDTTSLPLQHALEVGEVRRPILREEQAILHNSWARRPGSVWRKTRTWGHAAGVKSVAYYVAVWLPSPWTHQWLRNIHPFMDGLWPRLRPVSVPDHLLCPEDVE